MTHLSELFQNAAQLTARIEALEKLAHDPKDVGLLFDRLEDRVASLDTSVEALRQACLVPVVITDSSDELRVAFSALNEQMFALGDRFNAIEARLANLENANCTCYVRGDGKEYKCRFHGGQEET